MIQDVLRDIGYMSFALASSPDSAIGAARERCPALITADIRLGAGPCIEAVRHICSKAAIPVVYITATPWEVRQIVPDAIIVPKPFGEQSLKQGVARATAPSSN